MWVKRRVRKSVGLVWSGRRGLGKVRHQGRKPEWSRAENQGPKHVEKRTLVSSLPDAVATRPDDDVVDGVGGRSGTGLLASPAQRTGKTQQCRGGTAKEQKGADFVERGLRRRM